MRSVILTKKLNNTEIGRGGTHETYIYIPHSLDVSDLFEELNEKIRFYCPQNHKHYEFRLTHGREKRIVGLGPIYSDFDVYAGDEICLERRISTGREEFLVSIKTYSNVIVLQRRKLAFEVLNEDRLPLITDKSYLLEGDSKKPFSLAFKEAVKKRADSKEATKLYDLLIDGNSAVANYANADLFELSIEADRVEIKEFYGWKKIQIGD